MLSKTIARQLGNPSGLVGRFILGPLWNNRNSALNNVAYEALTLTPADRVLEIGFGGGYLLGRMSAVIATGCLSGVDISEAMVEFCRKHYRGALQAGKLDLKVGSVDRLPYPDGHFTKAVSVNSIFYWADVPQAMSEVARVLGQAGCLVLCFTDKSSLQQKDFARHSLKLYDGEAMQPLLAAARFHNITVARHADRHRVFWCVTAHL